MSDLAGVYPVGLPVIVHAQFDRDSLEVHAGLILGCCDPLAVGPYTGRIRAIIVKGGALHFVDRLEHYAGRRSACYWVHVGDAQVMADHFADQWDGDEIRRRVAVLTAGLGIRAHERSVT